MNRVHRFPARDPAAGPVCLLTRERAESRRVRPDRFFDMAQCQYRDGAYEARLPSEAEFRDLAIAFVAEERECCPGMAFEVVEEPRGVLVRATW